jgi:hypothetical protein
MLKSNEIKMILKCVCNWLAAFCLLLFVTIYDIYSLQLVSTWWQQSVNLYKNRKEAALYKRRNDKKSTK